MPSPLRILTRPVSHAERQIRSAYRLSKLTSSTVRKPSSSLGIAPETSAKMI